LVIKFTNALPLYFTISILTFFTPVRPSLALKATDYVVAIGIRLALHDRDNGPQWYLSTALDEHGIRSSRDHITKEGPRTGVAHIDNAPNITALPSANDTRFPEAIHHTKEPLLRCSSLPGPFLLPSNVTFAFAL
jgi:hypothetical protein